MTTAHDPADREAAAAQARANADAHRAKAADPATPPRHRATHRNQARSWDAAADAIERSDAPWWNDRSAR